MFHVSGRCAVRLTGKGCRIVTVTLAALAATAPTSRAGQGPQLLSAGVFTEAQAVRGESLYLDECGSCHGSTLRGVGEFGGPGLLGERFLERWRGKTLGELFDRTRTTMPQDSPGRLQAQEYADIIAFILKANDFPAGDQELTPAPDRLNQITIGSDPTAK
jgi:quinoprotein glucose dehydrogenase